MSRAVAYRHADWLSLVEPTGAFVTLPVLNRVFPNGLDHTSAAERQEVRDRRPVDHGDPAETTAWIEWVLTELLGWGARLRSGPAVPNTLNHIVPEHGAVLRPDHVLVEPDADGERVRALVCVAPPGTDFDRKVPGDRWSATPAERAAQLCRANGVGLALLTTGAEWRVVWAPRDGTPGGATFLSVLFTEEPATLDAFVSLFGAKRFFAVAADDTIEALLVQSVAAQEVVADQLGRQVRAAAELLVAAISRANRERGGALLANLAGAEIYQATVTVLMRLVFLLFAEERGLLPVDDEVYARGYALTTLREQLQRERDLHGEEPLERRSAAWFRLLALFRAVHGGLTHDTLRIPPYGGRLFDPDRFPFLEGRAVGENWRDVDADPVSVDDLTVLAVLDSLQVLQITEGGVREARQLSYRTLEVEQIGHVYEGLLDHSIRKVDAVTLGLVGKAGDEPEVPLVELENAAAGGREAFVAWLKATTGRTDKQIAKLLNTPPGESDRQLLAAAVDNDEALTDRLLPYVHLLRRDLRELPIVMLDGSVYVTQTSTRREGGVEYTTKDLADEVALHALEPLVYSPGPQDGAAPEDWRLRSSAELLDLKICDPAVGSGAILVAAGRYLADRVVEAWVAEGAEEAEGGDEEVRLNARRAVADRCLYGVDRDPLAAEMAKLSLWLTTMAKDRPFTFLDHAVRVGDALLGITDLDQIRWLHLDPAAGRKLHQNLFDWTAVLGPLVDDALERRRRLADIRVLSVRDAEDKARLTAEADADLEALRVIADVVCGAAISTATQKKTAMDDRLLAIAPRVAAALGEDVDADSRRVLLNELSDVAAEWLNAGRPDKAPVRRCLHWPLEFPEVFLGDRYASFSCLVGNPPFIGGSLISGAAGSDYREHLIRAIANGAKGWSDLVVFFFLRARAVSRRFGLLATNSVAQGDSSAVGLRALLDSGWVIDRAVSSTQWPGRAALEISKVWASCASWRGRVTLDGVSVSSIDEMLYPIPRSGWRKVPLVTSQGVCFKGSSIYGGGFTMSLEQATVMLQNHPDHRDVLQPYLGGQDLNTHPAHTPSRWVVNFRDWDEENARRYAAAWSWIDEHVRPERLAQDAVKYPKMVEQWWRFWNERVALYRSIRSLERVLVLTRVSKTVAVVFVPPGQVFADSLNVFAYDDDFHFGVLSSGFHYRWAVRYSSTLETRVRYTPSDVFETFPQPRADDDVAIAGRNLNAHRSELMLSANEGLTATYNRVNDPDDRTPGIARLRELHASLDLAVCSAYGWSDLNLEHGFHPVRMQGIRWTFSPAVATEVLERLLELNRARYEEEVAAGLRGGEHNNAPNRKKKSAASGEAMDLFSDSADGEGEER